MDDVRTPDPQESPDTRNGFKGDILQSQIHQRRIEHATTVTVDNNRYTTISTLEIRFAKDLNATSTDMIHRRIFDCSAMNISLDQLRITHGKVMPTEREYKTVFKDWRKCNVTKREYVSFKLESTQTISQL